MPIDSSIPLQAQAPQNPLEQYGRAMALKNAVQQNQSGQLQLQQQQQDMADQQKMRQAYMESGGDLETLQQKAMQMGVGPNTLMKVKEQLLKQRETIASIDDKELAVKKAHTEAIGAAAQSLLQLPPEQRAAAYGPVIQTLASQGRIKPGEVPAQYPGDEQIQLFANSARTAQQIIESVFKERETAAAESSAASRAKTAATSAATAAAKLPGEMAQSAQQVRANLAAQLGAATSQAEYQKILGAAPFEIAREFDGKTPEQARKLGLNAEQQTQAGQAAANASQTAAHQKVEEQQGAARLGIEGARNAREENTYQQTYGAGANTALVGVEPKLRTAATAAAQKAADEFGKAQAAERDMKTFIELARAGNKEAYAYLSPEGVLTLNTARGVTRVNRQEIDAYAGAGSLFDRIAGKAGKMVSGKSVSDDVLKDIEALHQQISGNSAATYNQKLGSINQNYHANFKPVEAAKPAASPASTGGWKVIGVK